MKPRTSICQDLPGEYFIGTPLTTDPDGVFHLQLTKYIQNGEVKWPQLRKEMIFSFFDRDGGGSITSVELGQVG